MTLTHTFGLVTRRWQGWIGAVQDRPWHVWIATRLLFLALLIVQQWPEIGGDSSYYYEKLTGLHLATTMPEYPVPVAWLLALPRLLPLPKLGYQFAFGLLMLLADVVFYAWLVRTKEGSTAVWWAILTGALGPLSYFRFDLLPAIAVAVALLIAKRHPVAAGAALAVGTALKLWPVLLILAFVGMRRRILPLLKGLVLTGAGLALVALVTTGPARLLSPLAYQGNRGLESESIWATVPMLQRLLHPATYDVHLSPFVAWEVFGPSVSIWTAVSTGATIVGLALVGFLAVRHWRDGLHDDWRMAALSTVAVLVLIVGNKTLSPQYLNWLAGPLAVLLARMPGRIRARAWIAPAFVVVIALTQWTYPGMVGYYTFGTDLVARWFSTFVLVVRNLGLAAAAVASFRWYLAASSPASLGGHLLRSAGQSAPVPTSR